MSLPTLEHATITLNRFGGLDLIMQARWVFWDRNDYTDEHGNYITPPAEELCYWREIYNLDTDTDFKTRFVVVHESEAPANQIFSTGNNHETA